MSRLGITVCIGLVVVGIGVCPTGARAQAAGRIGFVNTMTIMRQTPGFDAADSILAEMRAGFQQEANQLQSQIATAVTTIDQQQLTLNAGTRDAQLDSLQQMNARAQARIEEMQGLVQQRQNELLAPLEQRIQTVIEGVRAERDLAVIFDLANPNAAIVAADPVLDLTALVIRRLQGSGSP